MELSQAIKELKEYVKVDKEHRAVNSYNSDFDKFCDNHIESIETVLREYEVLELQYHLLREETNSQINRLQKENEELKENIERENKKKAFGTIAEMKLEDLIKNDYISKDKIREKIEEYRDKEYITEMCTLKKLLKEE